VRRQFTTIACSVFFLTALQPVPAREPASQSDPIQKPVPAANATAGVSEDQFKLEEYFRQLASEEHALAESYARLAALWKHQTLPANLDPAAAREIRNHYRRLAEIEEKAATAAAAAAEHHKRLAAQMGQLPVAAEQLRPVAAAFARAGK